MKEQKTLCIMTKTLHTQRFKYVFKIPLGTNVPPLATRICTPKFSLIKEPCILPLLDLSHLQISCLKCEDTTMHTLEHTISSLSSALASMLPTQRAPHVLWRICPMTLGPPYSCQWRKIFQHFSSFESTRKKGGKESHRLSLYTDKEVLFTLSLQ